MKQEPYNKPLYASMMVVAGGVGRVAAPSRRPANKIYKARNTAPPTRTAAAAVIFRSGALFSILLYGFVQTHTHTHTPNRTKVILYICVCFFERSNSLCRSRALSRRQIPTLMRNLYMAAVAKK